VDAPAIGRSTGPVEYRTPPLRGERPCYRHLVRFAIALVALVAAASGCATVGSAVADACPESRALRCATPPTCSLDRARGCRVCACSAWDPAGPVETERAGRPLQPGSDPAHAPTDRAPPAAARPP
jgi:hypothetical protein